VVIQALGWYLTMILLRSCSLGNILQFKDTSAGNLPPPVTANMTAVIITDSII
jgi:hypothetical protein